MSEKELSKPHDGLVRFAFSIQENAVSLLKEHLPPALASALDWPNLQVDSGSFVSDELRHSHSDLLYLVPYLDPSKEPLRAFLLLEHQSTDVPLMAYRIYGYEKAIWDRFLVGKHGQRKLPMIVPVVLSQVEGGWRSARQFADLIDAPDSLHELFQPHVPHFEYLVVDLAHTPFERLRGTESVRLVLGALKAMMEHTVLEWLPRIAADLWAAAPPELRRALLVYLLAGERIGLKRLVESVKSAEIPEAEKIIMSIAEELEAKGRKEGMEKGHQRGVEEGLRKGALMGQIQALQQVMGMASSAESDLVCLDEGQLQSLLAELKVRLAQR